MKLWSPSVSGCHEVPRFNMYRWDSTHFPTVCSMHVVLYAAQLSLKIKCRSLYEKMTITFNNLFVSRKQMQFTSRSRLFFILHVVLCFQQGVGLFLLDMLQNLVYFIPPVHMYVLCFLFRHLQNNWRFLIITNRFLEHLISALYKKNEVSLDYYTGNTWKYK